ncbi:nucleobindin-2 isoform X2 [Zootermopsis nevadensis]|uniref:nucleobindin-2 isoform X2 n=1 Tax=Zootermopsis nevadensis TaxID=136037 RepID=UPI000B8E27A9|nr:nucleobindin-2 isoform X2 [Zootermopsis nevadensis]
MHFFSGMRETLPLLLLFIVLQQAVSPPVTQKKKGHEDNKVDEEGEDDPNGILVEYNRYLKEIVTALESDPEFKTKLEKAEESDIRSGKIADELEYVNHHVRTKLDEIKRSELERLRHLATKEYELRHGLDTEHLKMPPEHVDLSNPHTFEIEDLRKLILKTTADIAEADRKRREEFKEYEMQKEFEKQEKLRILDEEHKKQLLKDIEDKNAKHKQHDPLHHPGSKQQLEEVWEKQDHMDNQEFNPRTFFHLHDLDGNGVWDADEVKALFLKELDKMYTPGEAEDDMRERIEELERMREHVFREADTNKDGLISYEEFLAQTQKPEFEKDAGWEGLDEQQVYTQDEYREFERKRQEEIQRLIAQGVIPPYPNGMPPPHPGFQQGPHGQQHHQQQFPPQPHPGQQILHYDNQVPHSNQVPQGQMYPPGQTYPAQVPMGQFHPNQLGQIPPQVHPGQASAQVHPGQVPPQVQPGQAPPQVQPGQVPSQVHPGQALPQVQPGQVPPQVHPGQAPPQVQPGQVKPSQIPIQTQQGQNSNINFPYQHVPQPIPQLRDPIDVKQLSQGEAHANANPVQVEKVH